MNWDASVERLLQKYCDEAQTREALHRASYYSYKKLTTCFNLPVIVLSCLSGSFQFLSKGYPEIEQHIVTGTASLSILTAIISAVGSYLKLGESTNKHERQCMAAFQQRGEAPAEPATGQAPGCGRVFAGM